MAAAAPALGGAYLLPSNFGPVREYVTIQAGQSEPYFTPVAAIRAPGDFLAIDPRGASVKLTATILRELAIMEAPLTSDGTWRFTTGDRVARTNKWARVNGEWKPVRPANSPARGAAQVEESAIPAGAERMDSIGILKAETYVSRNKPDRAALATTGKGFELSPVSHPNEVYADEAFRFVFLSEGKPVPGQTFSVVKSGEQYKDSPSRTDGKADAQGQASVKLKDPGVYVLEANWYSSPSPAPAGGPPIALTVNYTLTFEVTR